jgi:hypothetical protein
MESLTQIDQWPVPTAAAAVVLADGTVAGVRGPVGRRLPLAGGAKPQTANAVG